MDKDYLTLKRVLTANVEDYDVLCGEEVVGRIFLSQAGKWMWASKDLEGRAPAYATRRHGRRHCRRWRERGVATAATARLRNRAEFSGRSLLGLDRLASC